MKKIIYFFGAVCCFIIFSSWTNKSKDVQEQSIIGLWTVFFEDEKPTSFDCANCPTWEFKEDHTLTFTRYDKQQETTTWKIDDKGIMHFGKTLSGFQGTHPNKMSKMPTKLMFSKNGDYTELRFSHEGSIAPIILRKRSK